MVRQKDDDWLLLVKWTLFAMINAEELGINSKNIGEAMKSKKPDVMRFVGTEGDYGEELGLTKDWAVRIIRHVGNYGEVYERNVGSGSKLGIPRGLNQLWNAGGILYAPPIRVRALLIHTKRAADGPPLTSHSTHNCDRGQPTQRPATCAIAGTVTGLNIGSQPSMIRRLSGLFGVFDGFPRRLGRGLLHGDGAGPTSRSPLAPRLT